jgi:hypothetical protein
VIEMYKGANGPNENLEIHSQDLNFSKNLTNFVRTSIIDEPMYSKDETEECIKELGCTPYIRDIRKYFGKLAVRSIVEILPCWEYVKPLTKNEDGKVKILDKKERIQFFRGELGKYEDELGNNLFPSSDLRQGHIQRIVSTCVPCVANVNGIYAYVNCYIKNPNYKYGDTINKTDLAVLPIACLKHLYESYDHVVMASKTENLLTLPITTYFYKKKDQETKSKYSFPVIDVRYIVSKMKFKKDAVKKHSKSSNTGKKDNGVEKARPSKHKKTTRKNKKTNIDRQKKETPHVEEANKQTDEIPLEIKQSILNTRIPSSLYKAMGLEDNETLNPLRTECYEGSKIANFSSTAEAFLLMTCDENTLTEADRKKLSTLTLTDFDFSRILACILNQREFLNSFIERYLKENKISIDHGNLELDTILEYFGVSNNKKTPERKIKTNYNKLLAAICSFIIMHKFSESLKKCLLK